MNRKLKNIFKKLFLVFGEQYWWPADSSFEVIIGAILTQSTSWSNVEKAIKRLKENNLLNPRKLYRLPDKKLAGFIKSAGFNNIKALRLKNFLKFFFKAYQGRIKKIALQDTKKLRNELLTVKGIGPETADSILLYAFNKPVFVIDAYTKRILLRHNLIRDSDNYHAIQDLFMENLRNDVKMFNEYHALLVKLAKEYCRKSAPKCKECPLNGF